MKATAGKRTPAPRSTRAKKALPRPGLRALRRRAEALLEARPGEARRKRASVEHELKVHEVELRMQNAELRSLHRELEAARDWYRELYDAAPVGYLTTAHNGSILAVNSLASTILGLPAARLIGTRFESFVARASVSVYRDHRRRALARPAGHACDISLEGAAGRTVDVHLESSRYGGRELRTVVIDVTGPRRIERQMLEARGQLARALRVQTLGEMAPALAHELSQPLTAVLSYAAAALNVLNGRGGKPDPVEKMLGAISAQAERVERILNLIRRFVRKLPPRLEKQDLAAVVRDVVELATPLAKERRLKIEVDLDRSIPAVEMDTVGIQQVLLNLVMNGLVAMEQQPPGRRVLTIRTSREGQTARISVTDRGPGVKDAKDRIFDAFYSTKVGGLGLGLSISRQIVEQHGGALSVAPGAGVGATFVLSLPAKRPPR